MPNLSFQLHRTVRTLLTMLLTAGIAEAQSVNPPVGECEGPSDKVMVMALQDPVNPEVYLFVLKNNSGRPVTFFSIGIGHDPELRITALSVPQKVAVPAGWDGWFNIGDESNFVTWGWTLKSKDAAIAPGDLISGFKVILPPFTDKLKGSRDSDGNPTVPVKVAGLPFQVLLNGNCMWGRVVPLSTGSSAGAPH